MRFCQYKDVFGEPNKGIHSYRLFGVAIVDVILTFILAYVIWYYVYHDQSYWLILAIIFVIGILLHHLFCVKTTVDIWLFGK